MLTCRSCNSEKIVSIIPLGFLPLANALLKAPAETEETYNLEVMLCEECGLVQLKDLIDPEKLFSDYVYFSSNSEAMLTSVAALVKEITPTLQQDAFVIEIASNDGYLLKNYENIETLGIDPAENIAKVANQKGIKTLCAFFTETLALELAHQGKQADVIHANNVMAHVPDLNDFIKGLKVLLKEKGRAIIEVPHLLEMVKNIEFDTIYHEHVYYFSLKSLKNAFERHGLNIFNVEKLSLHGGSLRLFVSHKNTYVIEPIIAQILKEENDFDLESLSTYHKFMTKLYNLKETLTTQLKDLKAKNYSIAAYGASAKGTTLLNFFGITNKLIDFVVDRSHIKQGMYTPGTHLKILDPLELMKVDYALLLTWNFASEIMNQQKEFINKGGKFIIPLPTVDIRP